MAKKKENNNVAPLVIETQEEANSLVEELYSTEQVKELYVVSNRQAFYQKPYAEKYAADNKMKVFTVKL